MDVRIPLFLDRPVAPVAAVYVSPGTGADQERRLVFAIWRDGFVAWSADRVGGGRPWFTGDVEPTKVAGLLDALAAQGTLRDPPLTWSSYGPNASFTTIAIADGGRKLEMSSWHELLEDNPELVVTAHGIEALEGREREVVMAEQPPEYLRHRALWTEVRTRMDSLMPRVTLATQLSAPDGVPSSVSASRESATSVPGGGRLVEFILLEDPAAGRAAVAERVLVARVRNLGHDVVRLDSSVFVPRIMVVIVDDGGRRLPNSLTEGDLLERRWIVRVVPGGERDFRFSLGDVTDDPLKKGPYIVRCRAAMRPSYPPDWHVWQEDLESNELVLTQPK